MVFQATDTEVAFLFPSASATRSFIVGFWNCSDKRFPKPLFSHSYWNRLTHSLGLLHKGKAACTKLKRWFIANCLLWSSCWMLSALLLGGCSPTTPDKPPVPVLIQKMRSLQVCPAAYTDTCRANRLPFQLLHARTALLVKSSAAAVSTQEQCRWICQRQGEPLLCPLWSLTGWRGPLLPDQTQSPASS